jgi:C1A family cysteine protease
VNSEDKGKLTICTASRAKTIIFPHWKIKINMNTQLITEKRNATNNKLLLIATVALAISGIVTLAYSSNIHFSSLVSENNSLHENTMRDLFFEWKEFHGKHYSSQLEHEERFKIFIDNYNYAQSYNANPDNTAILGLTVFADLTNQEFRALTQQNHNLGLRLKDISESVEEVEIDVSALPASVDWRTKGVVLPVFDQGNCGSNWAIVVAQSLSSLNAINGGNLTAFSVQQIMDCSASYGTYGCDGGLPDQAFNYTSKYGVETEAAYPYPYLAKDEQCKYNASEVVYKNTGWGNVPSGNSVALAAALVNQPLSVSVDSSAFQLYTGGIITSTTCGTQIDRNILAVGYSSQNGQDYWILQNQWGPTWGIQGYVYIAKSNSTNNPGICGVAQVVNYPTI